MDYTKPMDFKVVVFFGNYGCNDLLPSEKGVSGGSTVVDNGEVEIEELTCFGFQIFINVIFSRGKERFIMTQMTTGWRCTCRFFPPSKAVNELR